MFRVLLRLAHAVVLAVFVGQVTGVLPPVESHDCEEICPGEDGPDDDCSPSCHLCTCCASLRLITTTLSVAVVPQPALDIFEWQFHERPPSPEPREILHVPKDGFA